MSTVLGLANLGNLYTGPSTLLDRPLTDEEIEQLSGNEQMANNALMTINHGVVGIGRILAGVGMKDISAGIDEDLVNSDTLSDIGFLLEGLGGLALKLNNSKNCLIDVMAQHTALTDKDSGIEKSRRGIRHE